MVIQNLNIPEAALADYCRRWKIDRLEVFGSILRDDFSDSSDVDFLATFARDARWSLFDLSDAEEELGRLVARSVDLIERSAVEQSENWIRRKAILETVKTVYVA